MLIKLTTEKTRIKLPELQPWEAELSSICSKLRW